MIAAALVAVTALIAAMGLDMRIAGLFYVRNVGFPVGDQQPWRLLYHYGTYPGLAMGATALMVVAGGFVRPTLVRFRRQALLVVLLLIIGPGMLVNTVFKDHWGRPRPRQVDVFGGTMSFHQPWQPGPVPKNASFPAGHPAIAFYLSAPYFALREARHRRQAVLWLWSGIGYGVVMGIARIMQGGHFLTDVVWSAGVVYLTGLALTAFMRRMPNAG